MKRALPLFVSLCLAAAAAVPALAQELTGTLKKVKESGSITIGHRETFVPFSYLDEKQNPIGYSMDLCAAIVEEVKRELQMPALVTKYNVVTSQTRIPLVSNGTVDLECASTTNNLTRQKQVAFGPVMFITGTRMLVKKSSKIRSYKDLKDKSVALIQGSTNERAIKSLSDKEKLGIKYLNTTDLAESFLALESGRVQAFATDDVHLYSYIGRAKNPKDLEVVGEFLTFDPYGIMFRKNDDDFGVVVRRTLAKLMASGEMKAIYDKWFVKPLPSGQVVGMPLSPIMKAAFEIQALTD